MGAAIGVGKFGNVFFLKMEWGRCKVGMGKVFFLKWKGGFKLFHVNVRKVGGFSEKRNLVRSHIGRL